MPTSHTSRETTLDPEDAKTRVLQLLASRRVMTVATLRPDGWPQATVVNYLADGLSLYFLVTRQSQKLANIAKDSRIAVALGADPQGDDAQGGPVGLSLAAHAAEVDDAARIAALNRRIWGAPEDKRFKPHPPGHSVALIEARPVMLSLIDYSLADATARHFTVRTDWRLEPA